VVRSSAASDVYKRQVKDKESKEPKAPKMK
jgi:hypothetical protein